MSDALVYDWNEQPASPHVYLLDTTLHLGLQASGTRTPSLEEMRRLIHRMAKAGVAAVDLGPISSRVRELVDDAPLTCVVSTGGAIDGLDASCQVALRVRGPGCDAALVRSWVNEIGASRTILVAEDAPRATARDLAALVGVAAELEVARFAISDGPGHATPSGVCNLVSFVRQEGFRGSLGWGGMNDRGLALANALTALGCGVDWIHATALGLGAGPGWVPLDLLVTNLAIMSTEQRDLQPLREYCEEVARVCGVEIPINYPVLGADAFRTATGVHAAAIVKARRKGDTWLADRVYSSVPAGLLGLSQTIDVGPMSGASNVTYWLERQGLAYTEDDVARILKLAKQSNRTLTAAEIRGVLGGVAEGVKDGSSASGR